MKTSKRTYIYLDDYEKARLFKIAHQKQLSVSTTANIIVNHLYILFDWHDDRNRRYLKRGSNQISIKLRNEHNYDLNCAIVSNCIYAYLHNEVIDINWKKVNSKIQSDMDKTIDPNNIKNIEIRLSYRIMKLMKGNK